MHETVFVSGPAAHRAALETVLSSSLFTRNPRLSSLLRYLCEHTFRGDRISVKEYDIATDVFHRSIDFDQTTDAIVRVEMHRLRKKLRDFYAGEGATQSVRIVLQTGRYLPEFVTRDEWVGGATRADEHPAAAFSELLAVQPAPLSDPRLAGASLAGKQPVSPQAVPAGVTGSERPARNRWLPIAALLLAFGGVGGAWLLYQRQTVAAAANINPPVHRSEPPAATVLPDSSAIRILCGSSDAGLHDLAGHEWLPDHSFAGGQAVKLPVRPIFRTHDPFLYRAMRSGEFTYKIPLKPGVYELKLHFADLNYRPGSEMEGGENTRVFSVWLNGSPLLHDVDVFAEAGPDTALVRVFKDVRPAEDGYLHLAFSKQVDQPMLNAIEILPGTPHRLLPVRLTTQDRPFKDRAGINWMPDDFFLHGRTQARFGSIAGTLDPRIFERERYGHFSYAIPVAPASRYKLTLHFAESYWGPDMQGGGGAGNRVFSVFCNGSVLLKDFDIYKEVGSNREVVKTFSDLPPSPQGSLLVDFVPARNYANISAMEVEDQGR